MSPDASFFQGLDESEDTRHSSAHPAENLPRVSIVTPSKRPRFFRSPSPPNDERSPTTKSSRQSPRSLENKLDSSEPQTPTRVNDVNRESSNQQAALSPIPANQHKRTKVSAPPESLNPPIRKAASTEDSKSPRPEDQPGRSSHNPSYPDENSLPKVPLFSNASDDESSVQPHSSPGPDCKPYMDPKPNTSYNLIDLTRSSDRSHVRPTSREIKQVNQVKSLLTAARPPTPAWEKKFLGGIMCEGYLICSSARLREGEPVWLSRSTAKATSKKNRKGVSAKNEDHVVRLESKNNGAFARLNEAFAKWIVHLIDQNLVYFEGTLMFPPARPSIGDTIHCYLKAYLRRSAFVSPTNPIFDSMRNIQSSKLSHFFSNVEAQEDKGRIDKQQSINQLFDAIGLTPTLDDQNKARPTVRSSIVKHRAAPSTKLDPEEEGAIPQESIDLVYQRATAHDKSLDLQSPCDGFTLPLRPYQQQGLSWLIKMEAKLEQAREKVSIHPLWEEYIFPHDEELADWFNRPDEKFYYNPYMGELSYEFPRAARKCQGGILADEMGLGKTIQMAALICTARPRHRPLHRQLLPNQPSNEETNNGGDHFSDEQGVEDHDNQSHSAPYKSPATLVICPLTLIDQWKDELERCHKALKVFVYHSVSKSELADVARDYDVVITTYGIIAKEWSTIESKSETASKLVGLFKFDWYRIILDEGHNIKNRSAQSSKACYNLAGKRRWILSGTPIVNRLEDLASLLHFIRLEPWGNFSFYRSFVTIPFSKKDPKALVVVQTIIESILLRREKNMKDLDGNPIVNLPPKHVSLAYLDLSRKERMIYDLVYKNAKSEFLEYLGQGTVLSNVTAILVILMRLRQAVLHPLLVLKKMKSMVSQKHEDTSIFGQMLKEYTNSAATANSFAASQFRDLEKKLMGEEADQVEEQECVLCLDVMDSRVYLPCMHAFCKDCIMAYIEARAGEETLCPSCQAPFQETGIVEFVINRSKKSSLPCSEISTPVAQSSTMSEDEQPEVDSTAVHELQRDAKPAESADLDYQIPSESIPLSISDDEDASTKGAYLERTDFVSSTKLEALTTHLNQVRREDPKFSAVVFSQFTGFLDLIEIVLRRDKFRFVRLDGTLSPSKRRRALATFNDPNRPCILVCSLKVAGVGLNLTKANRVFMMDTWWNEALENQAIDRIHRFGQDNPTFVVRFLVRDSIEDRMLAIQQKKRAIINDALGAADHQTTQSRTLEDLKSIFAD